MLSAYRGLASDRPPVAPEFWTYFPAKILGLPMIEFEREIPFWQSLKQVFEKFSCEGWGASFPQIQNQNLSVNRSLNGYEETIKYNYKGHVFTTKKMYSKEEPSWITKHLAEDETQLPGVIDMLLDMENEFNSPAIEREHALTGDSFLLEAWCGLPFFDFIAELTGFEKAVLYFMDEDPPVLERYRKRYQEYQLRFIDILCRQTSFESFVIGCSYSCNSLIGRNLWLRWDKPYIRAMAEKIHSRGKLLHIHFHGKSIESVSDFVEMGVDAVCPFERPPGGDIEGIAGLKKVRDLLDNKVTFNGNVHTVETLIFGNPEKVRSEVREIKEAFHTSNRYIIGSGDQVGGETPLENIVAMIEEAKK